MQVSIGETVEFSDDGQPCGSYHYQDPFKSFFRGLFTPAGKDVVAPPPRDHPHHKGLQFGLCCSDVNFWEEDTKSEPQNPPPNPLPIGQQRTTKPELLPPADGVGFSQEVCWARDTATGTVVTFLETRTISATKVPPAYIWTWQTTLIAQRDVTIIPSAWGAPGYCGLGLRLVENLFKNRDTFPAGAASGDVPTFVSYLGNGAAVTFEQAAAQKNVLFLSYYGGQPNFAFMALGPTNAVKRTLKANDRLEGRYVVTVADR
jgi:hypothetical protein